MKHKLKIEDLAVDSFVVAPAGAGRGTVRGFADTLGGEASAGGTCVDDTCAQDCNPSLEISCGTPDTCASMDDPCVYFCDVTQPHFFTCGVTCYAKQCA